MQPHAILVILVLAAGCTSPRDDATDGFGMSICTPSFYDDAPDSLVRATTAAAAQALRTVTQPELRQIRDACLAALTPKSPR